MRLHCEMVQDKQEKQGDSMKLTIDIDDFFKSKINAFKDGISEKEFQDIVGEAVCRSAVKLVTFRDENESIAIDGAIWSEIACVVATRETNRRTA